MFFCTLEDEAGNGQIPHFIFGGGDLHFIFPSHQDELPINWQK